MYLWTVYLALTDKEKDNFLNSGHLNPCFLVSYLLSYQTPPPNKLPQAVKRGKKDKWHDRMRRQVTCWSSSNNMPSPPARGAANRPGRHNTSTTPNPRSQQSPQTQAAATSSPKIQTKKKQKNNGYKYQQRPWYSVQRWHECQRSIIYAAQREVVRSDSACRRAVACLRRHLGANWLNATQPGRSSWMQRIVSNARTQFDFGTGARCVDDGFLLF